MRGLQVKASRNQTVNLTVRWNNSSNRSELLSEADKEEIIDVDNTQILGFIDSFTRGKGVCDV